MTKKQQVTQVDDSKKQMIIRLAFEVFYQHGFHATGVDRLLEDSGISKRTMYKYFRSKEDLIAATIAHYQKVTFDYVLEEISKRAKTPREKILLIFDIKREALERGNFNGCFAINAKLEYEGKHSLIENSCDQFNTALESFIAQLCMEAKCIKPLVMAQQIMILLNGAIVFGQSTRNSQIPNIAKEMANSLMG